ncbi:MAG TPA: hypothetical protein VKH44_11995, partial [Pirellulaceae bacterium]|nr:hypothetical protein [Pirellulaceae bacterium]
MMWETPGTLAIAIAFLLALLGSGVGIAFLVGRRGGRFSGGEKAEDERQLPERFVRELEKCLELGDYVTRDADALTAILAGQSTPAARQVASAVQQLIKTTKSLTGRVNRIGTDAHIARPQSDTRPVAAPIVRAEPESSSSALAPAYLAQDE